MRLRIVHAVVKAVVVSVAALSPVLNRSTAAAAAPNIWAIPSQKRAGTR
jgi:hypothetical protein